MAEEKLQSFSLKVGNQTLVGTYYKGQVAVWVHQGETPCLCEIDEPQVGRRNELSICKHFIGCFLEQTVTRCLWNKKMRPGDFMEKPNKESKVELEWLKQVLVKNGVALEDGKTYEPRARVVVSKEESK